MELEELFVEIEGFPNYLVSNYGRIINRVHNHDLRPSRATDGHAKVMLYRGGIGYTKQVHQLVAQAFFDEWEPGLEVRHIYPNFEDNSVTNLTLGDYVWV
jgi:hypothetical protein